MRTEIDTQGVVLPKLDLSEVDPDSDDDGRLFRHNGNSTITIENDEETDEPGLYSWDQEEEWWVPSGRYAEVLGGYYEDELAKQDHIEDLEESHENLRDDHDGLREAHDDLRDDKDQLRNDHSDLRDDHENLEFNHDSLRDDYDSHEDNTDNPHDVTYDQVDALPYSYKGSAGGVAELDDDRKIPESQLPAISIVETHVVDTEDDMVDLDAEQGDIAIVQEDRKSYILKGSDASNEDDWEKLKTPEDAVDSVFGRDGNVVAESGDYHIDQIDDSVHIDDFESLESDVDALDQWIEEVDNDLSSLESDHEDLRDDFDTHDHDEDYVSTDGDDIDGDMNVSGEISEDGKRVATREWTSDSFVDSPDVNNIHVGEDEPDDPDEYDIWIRL